MTLLEGSYYTEKEILDLNIASLNRRGMHYVYFEKDGIIYCFEKESDDKYYLFLKIDKEEFSNKMTFQSSIAG